MILSSFLKALAQLGDRRFRRVLLLGLGLALGDLLSFGSLIFMVVLSAFLMVPVASAITSMFLDEVAQAVEDRHYPALPPARRTSLGEAIRDTVKFLGVLILTNTLALALYALFTPAAPLIFWALNGYLLGVEYFTLAAMRRLDRQRVRELRRRHLLTIWLAGILMAMPLSVPLVNLLIPILGAATFTHIFHEIRRRDPDLPG